MKFKCVSGKNFKNYIFISDVTTSEDMEMYDTIKSVLERTEFKPFVNSFNKNLFYSYLFNEYVFPAQFWQDVKNSLTNLYGKCPILENEEILYFNDINEQKFQNWIKTLVVPDSIKLDDEKYKFQQDSAYQSILNKISRIEIATSGGKTFITYLHCRYIIDNIRESQDEKILIIVPSKLLASQLSKDFNEYQSKEKKKIIVESMYSGAKKIWGADIVCGTYQSLRNYDKEYFDDFRFVICDEVHGAKAYSIKEEIYNKITNAEFFFGMSGTYPKYKTLDYLHIISMFGSLVYRKTTRELMDEGISTPVKIKVLKMNYGASSDFSTNLLESKIEGKDKYSAEKLFFQQHETRNLFICKLLKKFPTNTLLLVDTLDYCDLLKQKFEEFFEKENIKKEIHIIHSKVDDRENIIQLMRDTEKDFILIGTYGTMSTGVSIKNIENIYFVDGGKSEIRIRQSIGRGMRLHPLKEYFIIFDFYDNIPKCSFANHAKERIRIYKEQQLDYKITEIQLTK